MIKNNTDIMHISGQSLQENSLQLAQGQVIGPTNHYIHSLKNLKMFIDYPLFVNSNINFMFTITVYLSIIFK